MRYRFWWRRDAWSSPGAFASAILAVGLVVIGVAVGVGGGDVPDGWVATEAEVVDPPPGHRDRRVRRALGAITVRFVQFEAEDGETVVRRCEYCWGGIGAPVSIAYDPEQPTNLRHLHFHRVAAAALVVTGVALFGVDVWWSTRQRARRGPPSPQR